MITHRTYYRRHLPHYHPPNATFFITFRLAGSLPAEVIVRLKREYDVKQTQAIKTPEEKNRLLQLVRIQKKYFADYDKALDGGMCGPHWLKDERIAELVATAITRRDNTQYRLLAYCIMPNHVHLVISTDLDESGQVRDPSHNLQKSLRSLKWYTALEANKILGRTGKPFWQSESYDHVVRDGKELERVIRYVQNNPVKAGLVDDPQRWKWSYIRPSVLP